MTLAGALLVAAPALAWEEPGRATVIQAPEEIVDSYVVSVSAGGIHGSAEVGLSFAQLQGRCGDGDGCSVRLLSILEDSFGETVFLRNRTLVLWDDGRRWRLYDDDGSPESSGNTDDSTSELILSVGDCELRDRHPFQQETRYYLVVYKSDAMGQLSSCVLRIAD